MTVGARAVFLGGPIPTSLRCAPGAGIVVGERSTCNYGVAIEATRSVRVGAECMIASLVHIRDDDGRHVGPVLIGDGVWIAHGAVIEPGSVVGDGAVVAAMAVVSGTVPPRCLAAGNPARWVPLEPGVLREGVGVQRPPAGAAAGEPVRSALSRAEVRRAIIDWLDDTRHFGQTERLLPDDKTSLCEAGLLDSLGLVQILAMLEERFGIAIDRALASRRDAQSMGALVDAVIGAGARA